MIQRLVAQQWNGENADPDDVVLTAEATDEDEIALHAHGGASGQVSHYMTRDEAVALGVLLIAAAHSSVA